MVADELGAAWEAVAVEPAPLAGAYANPLADERGSGRTRYPDHRQLDLHPRLRAADARGGGDCASDARRRRRRPLERRPARMRDCRRLRHQRRPDAHVRRAGRGSGRPAPAGTAPLRQTAEGPADGPAAAATRRAGESGRKLALRRRRAAAEHAVRIGPDGAAGRAADGFRSSAIGRLPGVRHVSRERSLAGGGRRQLVGGGTGAAEPPMPAFRA